MWILLSHRLSAETPCYDDGPRLEIAPVKQISRGDSSNTYLLKMLNHLGTHVDAPNHFDPDGRPIHSYTAEELVFKKPVLIEVAKGPGELITPSELEMFSKQLSTCDMLLIRTGFQRYRIQDTITYMKNGPCLSADTAKYLRSFENLRALGVDMISISSPAHREEGREAHRQLLKGRSFLIVEDMDLEEKPTNIKKVLIAPLMVEGVDSAPTTIFAEV